MMLEEYKRNINLCFRCGCWDPDTGCSMPGVDRSYACPLEADEEEEDGD
ncbi:MAG: hypothetical protein HFG64_10735 [Lachnospiraceae bacterium]|nr:hypothetical protein [Lachnospiraceae bacterium]